MTATVQPAATTADPTTARAAPRCTCASSRRRNRRSPTRASRCAWCSPGSPVPRPAHRPGPRPRPDRPPAADGDFGPTWSSRADLPAAAVAGRTAAGPARPGGAGRSAAVTPAAPVHDAGPVRLPVRRPTAALVRRRRRPRSSSGRVHVCEPVDGVAEVSAVARRAGRAHAVAARLEGLDGRWRCTALQIG